MLSRGRARTVSPIALARKHFEEELRRWDAELMLELNLSVHSPKPRSPLVPACPPPCKPINLSSYGNKAGTPPTSPLAVMPPLCRAPSPPPALHREPDASPTLPIAPPTPPADNAIVTLPVPCHIPSCFMPDCQPSPPLIDIIPARTPSPERAPSRKSYRSFSSQSSLTRSHSPAGTPAEPVTPPDSDYAPTYPPDPPLSLEDQMQNAYALEDMRLAKLLLLQLRGASAHSLSDPRIDQLTDDDFEGCFVPPGGGMRLEPEHEAWVRECEERAARRRECEEEARRERALWRKRERWLLGVSEKWEKAKGELREERINALVEREARDSQERRRRERLAEQQKIVAAERAERKLRQKQSKAAQSSRYSPPARPSQPSQPSTTRSEEPFLYDFPMPSRSPSRTRPCGSRLQLDVTNPISGAPSTSTHLQEIAQLQSAQPSPVPIDVVACSMHGPLFPLEPMEQHDAEVYGPRTLASCILDELLAPVEWEPGERWAEYRTLINKSNVKEKEIASTSPIRRRSSSGRCAACAGPLSSDSEACSSTSASTSLRVPTPVSRRGSWLSFGSRSSASTAATTPAASVTSKRMSFLSTVSLTAEIRGLLVAKHADLAEAPVIATSAEHRVCACVRSGMTPVAGDHHPLFEPAIRRTRVPASVLLARRAVEGVPEASRTLTIAARVRRSLATFVDVAQRFQEAYVRVTLISVPLYTDSGMFDDDYTDGRRRRAASRSWSRSRSRSASPFRRFTLGKADERSQPGHRVRACDLRLFLVSPDDAPRAAVARLPINISMRVLSSTASPPPARVFPPPTALTRSPLKPRFPPAAPEGRVRPVGNHVHLRLVALGNVCALKGVRWQSARGTLAAGQERMRGVAVEGIGRSGLAREVRVEVVQEVVSVGGAVGWRKGIPVAASGRRVITVPRRW